MLRIGLDIGSTTVKCVVLDEDNNIIYKTYERHYSQITSKISELLKKVRKEVPNVEGALIAMSGSAGMGVANFWFTQQELPQKPLFPVPML